mmetsp:Transcript_4117/g.6365  ORF Transcript_4117/g.6365 Transcript_4117/m.6365 type:complete len:176 (-) Transcript_4117:102-629(-)
MLFWLLFVLVAAKGSVHGGNYRPVSMRSSHGRASPLLRRTSHRFTSPRSPRYSPHFLRCRAESEGDTDQQAVEEKEEEKRGVDWSGVRQLISMGMGTMAGDIKEINLDDPKRTVVLELEANNFEDENGQPLSGKYRDKGWVDETSDPAPMINQIAIAVLSILSLLLVVLTLKNLS